VHFDDPKAFNRIFSLGNHLTKDPTLYSCFGVNASTFGSIDAAEAKARRDVLNPFFEKRSIMELEDVIRFNVRGALLPVAAHCSHSRKRLTY
jgi:hypothetical protein